MLKVEVVTAEAVKYQGDARQVLLPGVNGEMGILSHHAPLVSMLNPGIVRVDGPEGNQTKFAVSQGFATVEGDKVICLVDAAFAADEVDSAKVYSKMDKLRGSHAANAAESERNQVELRFLQAQLDLVGAR